MRANPNNRVVLCPFSIGYNMRVYRIQVHFVEKLLQRNTRLRSERFIYLRKTFVNSDDKRFKSSKNSGRIDEIEKRDVGDHPLAQEITEFHVLRERNQRTFSLIILKDKPIAYIFITIHITSKFCNSSKIYIIII